MPSLREVDELVSLGIEREVDRQRRELVLIASENFASRAVLEATGSVLTNKYAEGYPGRRYYAGCENFDYIEKLAINRAKELFSASEVNVQPHSGSQANMAAYFSMVPIGGKIMAMKLDHGGHLTHGSKVNFSGKFYKFCHYGVDHDTETLNYLEIAKMAKSFRPDLIVAGYTAYPREVDFKEFKHIADDVGAKLLVDMSHISGLIAGKVHQSPVEWADVITSTTHKTLRGPRGAMALTKTPFIKSYNSSVFPNIQGGPMGHVIAGKAVAFFEALQPGFSLYAQQIVKNSRILASELLENGFRIVSGGTDTHMILVDVRTLSMTGAEAENVLKSAGIVVNKNSIPFDPNPPVITSGIRIGTAAVTSRGFMESDMRYLSSLIIDALRYKTDVKSINKISNKVSEFARSFKLPGVDD